MKSRTNLRRKLSRAFALQAVAIGATAALGVYAAGLILEEVLVRQALIKEADHYWRRYDNDPAYPRPDTYNLRGYVVSRDREAIPEWIAGRTPGFHEIADQPGTSLAYISRHRDDTLLLLFDGDQVRKLSLYFGLFPLAAVLTVIYLLTWVSYRAARRAVSPVVWLAQEVAKLDPAMPDPKPFAEPNLPVNTDREVLALAEALSRFASQLNLFVERETRFTRDASHELRSPLTVIKLAADMLLSEQELSPPALKSVERIRSAANDMEQLVDALLLLARESEAGVSRERVCVNEVVREEIDRARLLFADKPVEIIERFENALSTETSDKALSIVIGNLLRNAASYTDQGRVTVRIDDNRVTIADSGIGMSEEELGKVFQPYFRADSRRRGGHGVGLTIVKRFADRFGWVLDLHSQPGEGTRVVMEFPVAQVSPLESELPVSA